MKFFVVLPILLLLSSCGTGVSKSHKYKGKQVYKAKCNGVIRDISSCHEQASETCNGNYEIFGGSNETTGGFVMNNQVMATKKRSLMFYCN